MTEEMAALEDENRRLSEVIQAESPHTEELLLHVKELQHVSADGKLNVLDILCDLYVVASPAASADLQHSQLAFDLAAEGCLSYAECTNRLWYGDTLGHPNN